MIRSLKKLTALGSVIGKGGITIMSMAKSKQKIWLATLEGVVSYPSDEDILSNKNSFSLLSDPWQSNLHFVFQVYVDSKNKTWFATDGNGVFCDNGNKIVQYSGDDKSTTSHSLFSLRRSSWSYVVQYA
jgi:hypothetical protein